jgi:hypothetical protein
MFFVMEKEEEKNQQLHMVRSTTETVILEYIEELKKLGYEIIDFPPIEKIRHTYSTNLLVEKIN